MKNLTFKLFIATLMFVFVSTYAQSRGQKALVKVDNFFIKQYVQNCKQVGNTIKPVLLINGFNYTLLTPDNKQERFNDLKIPFSELKTISHIGPGLFAIAQSSWLKPNGHWKYSLRKYQRLIQRSIRKFPSIDWRNTQWAGKEKQLQTFMLDSLKLANRFIGQVLKKNEFSRNEYQTFAQHYLHTMVATMYLADVANTSAALSQLHKWKKQLGKQWDDLYVVVYGSKGRLTAGLTVQTNTAASTVASLMKPELAKTHIIIAPAATNKQTALQNLGAVINARSLAKLTFTTDSEQQLTGLFKALNNPTVPLAMSNVKTIILQDLKNGKVTLPEMQMKKENKEAYLKK